MSIKTGEQSARSDYIKLRKTITKESAIQVMLEKYNKLIDLIDDNGNAIELLGYIQGIRAIEKENES